LVLMSRRSGPGCQLSVAMARGVLAAGSGHLAATRARRDDAYLPNYVYLPALIVVSRKAGPAEVGLAAWEITYGLGGARVGDAATWHGRQRNSMLSALVWLALLQDDAHTPVQQSRRQPFHRILHRRRLRRWVARGSLQSTVMHCHRLPTQPMQPTQPFQPTQPTQPGARRQVPDAQGKRPHWRKAAD
jgi:hypothetical protein